MSGVDARPPVNEVVISISFRSQPLLEGPRLMVALAGVLDELPRVDEVPPYEIAEELQFEDQLLAPVVPQIQIIHQQPFRRRLWFTNPEDPTILLQAQSDYFALNWRRQQEGREYPGFETLKDEFFRYLDMVNRALNDRPGGRPIVASRVEITYINLLKPDAIWGSFRDLGDVVSLTVPERSTVEQLNAGYSRSIEREGGGFFGRLHSSVSTVWQPKISVDKGLRPLSVRDMVPTINISLTARSGGLSTEPDTIGDAFELAHDSVTIEFKRLTTDRARTSWGIQ